MTHNQRFFTVAIAALSMGIGSAAAGPGHSHGEAKMLVSLEGDQLVVNVEADLLDLVSFERRPSTDAERAAIDELHKTLIANDGLVSPASNGECSAPTGETTGGYKPDAPETDTAKAHLVSMTWTWSCAAADKLRTIDVGLFEAYPAIKKIDTIAFRQSRQSGAVLTATAARLSLP